MKKLQKGFTMIELLIVIAILGVLAVAVLSAINPLEQIRRGRDTGSRSDAEQILNAMERYNSSKGYFPWQTAEGDTSAFTWAPSTDTGSQWVTTLSTLVDADEIKTGFTSRVTSPTGRGIYLYYMGGTGSWSAYACFLPQSKSMQQDAAKECSSKVTQTDFPDDACPGDCTSGTYAANQSCHLCLP